MKTSSNWIHDEKPVLSLKDKLKALLKIGHKLVLVQKHELERLKLLKHPDRYGVYIEELYTHYIVNNLPKTYLR